MALAPGARLGPYEILDKLGEGGMGQVYRARDTRLHRDVAVKVLPELFALDPDRLARFTREAQTLASLNHPNIAAVYGIEGAALVMELVDGEDLSVLIARGPMPLDEVLPIARHIAEALEAAHDHGIVHRDLKPANIKVRPDGTVKVLDFGLAKTADEPRGGTQDRATSPTFTSPVMRTQVGMIVGTAAYMAPEQARGKVADKRADIWSFGVVLFEMLTGRPVFGGPEISDVLASVLRQDIPWPALPGGTPPRLRRLLDRCLERDPKLRLRDIGEARVELAKTEAGTADSSAGLAAPLTAAARRSTGATAWPALCAILIAALGGAWWWGSHRPAPAAALARLSLLPPLGTSFYPDSSDAAISPDGTMVAFITGGVAQATTQLWVRRLDSLTPRLVAGGEGPQLPFWSPDSRRIGFFTRTKLEIVAASGGRPEIVCDAASGGRGAAWAPDNTIVFPGDAGGPLLRVAASGGTPAPLTVLDASRHEYSHRFPAMLPDGDHFLYASLPAHNGRFDIFVGSLSHAGRTQIGSMESAPVYAAPGSLLFARQGVLVAQHFDLKTLATQGDPVALDDEPTFVLDPKLSFTAGHATLASTAGSIAYYSSASTNVRAEWYDASGRVSGTLDLPVGHYDKVRISPDGTRAMLVRSTSVSESALWLLDFATGTLAPLAAAPGRNDQPVWSPDGTRIAFDADGGGAADLFVKRVGDGSPPTPLYRSSDLFKNPEAWSPDGRWIVVTQLDPQTAQDIWLLPAAGGTLVPFFQGPRRDGGVAVSPDGRWLAYISDETGRFELSVDSFPQPGHRVHISRSGAFEAWWTPDGRSLIFTGDDMRSLWRADVQSGASFAVAAPVQIATLPAGIVSIDAMPDRSRFLALVPERSGAGSITVVQNWSAALDAKR